MARQIIPPRPQQVNSTDLLNWHDVFKPNFGELLATGYVDGANAISYGSTIQALAVGDNEVQFFGAASGTKMNGLPTPLSASTVYAVSDNAADTHECHVYGLDAAGDQQVQTVTLTGTTPVAVAGTWNHVRALVSSGADNTGNLFVSTDAAAVPTTLSDQIQCVVAAATAGRLNENYGINPVLVCPNEATINIHGIDLSISQQDGAVVRVYANRQGQWILNFEFYVYQNTYSQRFYTPINLAQGDRLAVMVQRTGAGGAADCAFGMNGYVLNAKAANPNNPLGIAVLYE
jgi:hypothetical protein